MADAIAEEAALDLDGVGVDGEAAVDDGARDCDFSVGRRGEWSVGTGERVGRFDRGFGDDERSLASLRRVGAAIREGSVAWGAFDDRVLKGQGDAGHTERAAAGGTGEDDVGHLFAAQGFAGAFAEDPFDGVHDVGLAAPVGADDAGDGIVEAELGPIGERLETAKSELCQPHT